MNDLINKTWDIKSLSDDEKVLLRSVAKDATQTEMMMFLHYCNKLQLDPFRKQIYFIKYGSAVPAIVVGIEGFRSIAQRSGLLSGIQRGSLKDKDGNLVGAWAEVYRKDWQKPARSEVELKEYNTGKSMWAKMPSVMIQKVAEVAALRMAFADDMTGAYSHEEMDQAGINVISDVVTNQEKD